jgi:hypothetical protein
MSQKLMTVTIKDLDITQMWKIAQSLEGVCDRTSVAGAYRYELKELVQKLLRETQAGRTEFTAPDLTV